ncbi:MAG TPA: flagellar motor switch protein FliN [Fimbriimonadaceae bacterium]|jgi:flagellar motor switch protein FliN/FliY
MSKLSPEALEKFSGLQEQIWENATNAVAQVSESPISFSFQPPEVVPPEMARVLAGELALTVQFAFASAPEHNQFLVIPSSEFASLASYIKGEQIAEPDENLIPELREFLEGMVQGICLACGIAKNEPMVATGLSIRYQILSLPDNFGRNDELVKTEIAFGSGEPIGSLSWFIDKPTAEYIAGSEAEDEQTAQNAAQGFANAAALAASNQMHEEVGGLSLLMDVPLEISVELGRMSMLVRDVVELGTGSIVEIDKAAGEPVDVMVNGRLVARGEVVVIEDNFGVRITEIVANQDRLGRIGEAA